MKKAKMFLAVALAIALLSIPVGGLLAALPAIPLPGAPPVGFKSASGVITEVTKSGENVLVMIEGANEQLTGFVVTEDTYVFEGVSLVAGQKVKGFYDISLPAPAIFPPRYSAAVIAGTGGKDNVFVGYFGEGLLSSDNELKLNIGEDTVVVDRDGEEYDGDLEGKNLAVVYAVVTMSIPGQTTPSKVVVLDAEAEDEADVSVAAPEAAYTDLEVSKMPIVVEGEVIDAPPAYVNADGRVMVPVRAIAEALGFKVTWDDETRMVIIGNIITFAPGKDYYTYARMAPISLGVAPELKDGRTYVPLSLFTEVARFNNAYIFEGQIVIDNQEKMQ